MDMIKTKVVCTLGPASDDPEILRGLVRSGIDVARMNFSHGTHAQQLERLKLFNKICREENEIIPVLLDTKGPEIRLGTFPAGEITIADGQKYIITTENVPCDETRASVSYEGLINDIRPGNSILIDDGLVRLEVESISGKDIICRAINGGTVSSRKSVNVPGVKTSLPSLNAQDRDDLSFAVEHDYDFVAVSFVRKKEDILEVAALLDSLGGGDIKLIAKIESREGVDNLEDIIRVSDGIMVARGDLGVEIPVEEIPVVQKQMIKSCYRAGKPVITATQMLDSMIRNPRPTRAEVTDVANAIYDGTSAIMLSGETASGKYPVEALQTMKRIAKTTEKSIHYWNRFRQHEAESGSSIANAISHATCTTAMDLSAAAIVAVTTSGSTARKISSYRPECPIIAATTSPKALRQLKISWGVYPMLTDVVKSTDEIFAMAAEAATGSRLVSNGDAIVVTAGVPLGMSGTTNMLKVQMIGNVLCRGKGIGKTGIIGKAHLVNSEKDALKGSSKGQVLVISAVSDDILPLFKASAAVVIEGEDKDGKAETLAKALQIPVITGADGATQILKNGTMLFVDPEKGTVEYV